MILICMPGPQKNDMLCTVCHNNDLDWSSGLNCCASMVECCLALGDAQGEVQQLWLGLQQKGLFAVFRHLCAQREAACIFFSGGLSSAAVAGLEVLYCYILIGMFAPTCMYLAPVDAHYC